jgi:hypothetical protein
MLYVAQCTVLDDSTGYRARDLEIAATKRELLYLNAVYHLGEQGEAVVTSNLAEALGISMASVSER